MPTPMLPTMPEEILTKISNALLPYKDDLRSLSEVSSQFVRPSRKALFRDCCTSIHNDPRYSLQQFTEDAATQSSISCSVKTLVLESGGATQSRPIPITLIQIMRLLEVLPAITSLTLVGFEWSPSLNTPSIPFTCVSLKHLALDDITSKSGSESPLEALCLSKHWSTVCINNLDSGTEDVLLQSGPYVVDRLNLSWCPFYDTTWTMGLVGNCHKLQGISELSVKDVVHQQVDMLRQLLEVSRTTLKSIELDFCSVFPGE